jgi:hypothetical protein
MSVMDEGKIDFAGIDKNERLVLTITDHLAWGIEADDVHLLMLQNKINDYLRFIESDEVDEHFSPDKYKGIVIRIIAMYPFSSVCIELFGKAAPIINEAGYALEWEVSEEI